MSGPETVVKICHAWFAEGMADECFWEGWPGAPVCDGLTPKMVVDAINSLRDPAVIAALPELQALVAEAVAQERERCAAEMDLAAHIMSHHGSDLETRAYQNAAAAIHAGGKP